MQTIQCGHCGRTHADIATVKACSENRVHPCHWLVERLVGDPECGYETAHVDCGADATETERGWSCAAGHEHVTITARVAEGWDYAEDAGEALTMVGAGITPVTMDGHLATSPRDFDPR